MATIKALNDTLYPAALAGLLVVAFTASHSNTPAASELDAATPFGAEGVEYLIQRTATSADTEICEDEKTARDTVWAGKASRPAVTLELVVDEFAGKASSHAVRVLLNGSELASSL